MFGQELGQRLGQSLIVDNRTGGMTMIAVEQLIRSPPDGYTLMIGTSESTMLPFLKKSYRYDPIKDFTPVALLATSWTVFAVNPKVPANTLPELVAYSKSHPGRALRQRRRRRRAAHRGRDAQAQDRRDFVHVPYRGGAQAATDAISGQIEMVSMGLASTRVAESGQLRILAQTGPSRHPMFPDVPTTAELGFPDVRMDTWFGLVGAARTCRSRWSSRARRASSSAIVQEPAFRTSCPRSAARWPGSRRPSSGIHRRRQQEMGAS